MYKAAAFFALLLSTSVVSAEVDSEIAHLMHQVESSECTFERNGKTYSGQGALDHIKKKYKYFENKIDSAELFIEYSASKSTMSGKPYWIKCPSQPKIKSQQWLLDKLESYRQGR